MRVEPVKIQPPQHSAADIRGFVQMVSGIQDCGVVLALDDGAYFSELKTAVDAGAPHGLIENLVEPRGEGWTIYHGDRIRLNYWRQGPFWLVAGAGATPATPIWLSEPSAVLDEIGYLLGFFLEGDTPITYLMTEDSDRRPVAGYDELRPYQKRRFLYFNEGRAVLHHRLVDGIVEGTHIRTAEYYLEVTGVSTGRLRMVHDADRAQVLSVEGPDEVDDVPF